MRTLANVLYSCGSSDSALIVHIGRTAPVGRYSSEKSNIIGLISLELDAAAALKKGPFHLVARAITFLYSIKFHEKTKSFMKILICHKGI